jgi:hypothetical protein
MTYWQTPEFFDPRYYELDGFDPDLVGFDCFGEIERDDPAPRCPFKPGCGLPLAQCPLRAQLFRIARAPKRVQ